MPTAMEVMREVDESITAVQKRRLVFEFLHHDACRREGRGRWLPAASSPFWTVSQGGR
jgi:hypothetical protein